MTKADLIMKVAQDSGLTRAQATRAVDATFTRWPASSPPAAT